MHDFVWYTPEHKSRALALVRRIDEAECQRRRCNPLAFKLDCAPIPDTTGVVSGQGTCVFPNFLGACHMGTHGPSVSVVQHTGRGLVLVLADALQIREIEPGLVVGDFRDRDAFLSSPEMQRAARDQDAAEANDREACMRRHLEALMMAAAMAAAEVKALSAPEPWYRRWFFRTKPLMARIHTRASDMLEAIAGIASPAPEHVLPVDPEQNARAGLSRLKGSPNAA